VWSLWSFLLLFCVVVAGCSRKQETPAPAASASAAVVGPQLVADALEHDFGEVDAGAVLEHEFVLRNQGSEPVQVTRVVTSCECLKANAETAEVPGGGEFRLKLTLDTKGLQRVPVKVVTLHTSDPAQKQLRLRVRARIRPEISFEPRFVQLRAEQGKTATADAWLVGTKASQISALELGPSDDAQVTAEVIEEVVEGGTRRGVRLHLAAGDVGRGHGRILVKSGLAEAPELRLQFNWQRTGNLQVTPRVAILPRGGGPRVVTITSSRDDLKVTAVRVQDGPFDARLEEDPPGTFKVHVEPKKDAEGAARGVVVVETNDPLEPRKEIQIRSPQRQRGGPPRNPRGPGKEQEEDEGEDREADAEGADAPPAGSD
jgi:hypothetical protein